MVLWPAEVECALIGSSSSHTNLVQLVLVPTHIHGNCLDLIFSNNPERLHSVLVDSSSLSLTILCF